MAASPSRGEERLTLDGRIVAGVAVAVFLIVLGAVGSVRGGGTPWRKVGVDATSTRFEDLRSITSSWDCERKGIEAFPSNPCDPYGRPANYPRLWTKLSVLGLGEGATTALGVAVGLIFLVAALAATGPLSTREGVLYAALLVAPATMIGVERGNVDLLMFALVVLGLALVRRSPWAGAAPIVLAAVLKLFPAFALAVLVRRRGRWAALGASVLVLAVYAALTLNDIRTLRHVIPRAVLNAYGAGVVPVALHDEGVSWMRSGSDERLLRLGIIAAGLLLAGGFLLGRRGDAAAADERRLDAFWAGAGVYVGTYLYGNNFDYRLVFLLLCVPQLSSWARGGGAPAPWPGAVLVAMVATFWLSSAFPPLPFGLQSWYLHLKAPPEELLNWAIFAWLVAALVSGVVSLLWPRPAARLEELGQQ